MSTTSKPAVTPEMVEKARQYDLKHRFDIDTYHGCLELAASFAASAVQDAVRECILIAEDAGRVEGKDEWERGWRSAAESIESALSEKYGVKP